MRTLSRRSSFVVAAGVTGSLLVAGLFHGRLLHARAAGPDAAAPFSTWTQYGGSNSDSQYSSLSQINRSNVSQLQQAWFYPAGNNGFRYGFNPIVVDGTMYVLGKNNSLAAVDAATGKELWANDLGGNVRLISHRGISYWESKDRSDRRILLTANNFLREIDAKTGKDVSSFGVEGKVDLREGLGRVPATIRQIQSGTPGRVFENLMILGSATGEEYESPPGDLRAFDILTGKQVWSFHTVPHPGEMGYDTWPKDAWKYIGGTNTWGEISIDEKRGIAYFPLGSPTYDFYGADRAGANLFSDCLLALDARTGKYLWHFQTTHHDLWDYDLETGPKLLTIKHDGKMVDIVAQPGKNGFLYVFNRVTGKPIWPIEERAVPQSDVPGEQSWPTQPYPTKLPAFARQSFSPSDVDPYIADAKEREELKLEVSKARNHGLYTPPSLQTTMETPGNNGGANWGSGAVDPTTGMLYVVSKDAPSLLHLEARPPRREMTGTPESQGMIVYLQNCQGCHTASRKGQPPAIPSLEGIVQRSGADHVKYAVQNGLPPMPAFPDLDTKDLEHLVAYLDHPEKASVPGDILARMMAPSPVVQKLGPGGQRYWTGYGYMNSTEGLPAIAPPWSSITAYDLNEGTLKWKIPLGGVDEVIKRGGPKDTGSYWPRGGAVVTAGGLVIVPSKSDSKLHLYDKETGAELYAITLPTSPEGIPAVYEVNGREYIAVSGRPNTDSIGGAKPTDPTKPLGGPQPATQQGYYVFALPEKVAKVQKEAGR